MVKDASDQGTVDAFQDEPGRKRPGRKPKDGVSAQSDAQRAKEYRDRKRALRDNCAGVLDKARPALREKLIKQLGQLLVAGIGAPTLTLFTDAETFLKHEKQLDQLVNLHMPDVAVLDLDDVQVKRVRRYVIEKRMYVDDTSIGRLMYLARKETPGYRDRELEERAVLDWLFGHLEHGGSEILLKTALPLLLKAAEPYDAFNQLGS